ncbi:MAG: efflux RND transporter periplasmic adaptor subunit [Burkholderiales bacterium]|nr:efflux RND transporter periplasmic adaptor subunit [Burkholderiales bacterium]
MIRSIHRLLLLSGVVLLAGCQAEQPPATAGRPVSVVTVEASVLRDAASLTGDVQARKDVDAAFRVGGRMIERGVNVGDRVTAGQVLAKLDPATEQNALTAAKATLAAARGDVMTARNTFDRQDQLIGQGFTTRPRFDQAKQALETAQSRLEDAEARVETARDRLRFTELRADSAGVVTARGAEPGEVVQPGRMIVRIARDDDRDAVFDVPATILASGTADVRIRVTLVADPSVSAEGRVREVAPEADPVTRTFKVRVALERPPEAMRLGATVNGAFDLRSSVVVAIPASALTSSNRAPAVWIVDPATSSVSLRVVDVLRFEPDRVVIAQGLEPGEVIVTAGVQALHPGQRVKPLVPPRTSSTGSNRAQGAWAENASRESRG